jgi:hypothetical protein
LAISKGAYYALGFPSWLFLKRLTDVNIVLVFLLIYSFLYLQSMTTVLKNKTKFLCFAVIMISGAHLTYSATTPQQSRDFSKKQRAIKTRGKTAATQQQSSNFDEKRTTKTGRTTADQSAQQCGQNWTPWQNAALGAIIVGPMALSSFLKSTSNSFFKPAVVTPECSRVKFLKDFGMIFGASIAAIAGIAVVAITAGFVETEVRHYQVLRREKEKERQEKERKRLEQDKMYKECLEKIKKEREEREKWVREMRQKEERDMRETWEEWERGGREKVERWERERDIFQKQDQVNPNPQD